MKDFGFKGILDMRNQLTAFKSLSPALEMHTALRDLHESFRTPFDRMQLTSALESVKWAGEIADRHRLVNPLFEAAQQMRTLHGKSSLADLVSTFPKQLAIEKASIGALTAGFDAVRPFLDTNERFRSMFEPPAWTRYDEMMKLAVGPSLALLDCIDQTRALGPMTMDDGYGVLAWRDASTDDGEERTLTAAIHPTDAPATGSATTRRVNVAVDVRCSRCGSHLMPVGSSYSVTSEIDVSLDLTVVPWCKCMKEWDGTAADLLKSGAGPLLRLLRGGGDGDARPLGDLRLVEQTATVPPDAEDDE